MARRLQIIGDYNRIKILCVIFENDNLCVSEIAKRLRLSVAIVSHHLLSLSGAKILEPIRNGKMTCYKLMQNDFTSDLKKLICKYK